MPNSSYTMDYHATAKKGERVVNVPISKTVSK
jgi:hypothetical protein